MKKLLLFSLSFTLLLSIPSFGQQNKKNDKSNANNDDGRVNLLLPHGNIGINTLTPSERLEVIGNVRISHSLFVNEIDVVGLSSTNITVREDVQIGRDLFVSGNIGIGIMQPSERLDINGNIRVSQKIFSDDIETNNFTGNKGIFNQHLVVEENLTVGGLTGLGVTAPTERLEVEGNIKVTETLLTNGLQAQTGSFSSNVEINEQLLVNGNVGFGKASPTERLEVEGNLKVSQGVFTGTIEGETFIFNEGTLSNQLLVQGNNIVEGNVGIGISTPSEKLEVNGNIKATGNFTGNDLFVNQGSFNGDVALSQNLNVEGSSSFSGDVATNNLKVLNNLESNTLTASNGNVNNDLSVGGNILVNGNSGLGVEAPSERLEVAGNIKASGDLIGENVTARGGDFSHNVNINQNFAVSGPSNFTGDVTTNNLTVLNNLDLKNGLTLGNSLGVGVATPEANLHVAGDAKFEGNITAVKLIVQELEVANLNTGSEQTEGQISFNDNLFVKGNLGVGTEKVEGYSLSVNGKIRASDDIKVYPAAQWADYVFEEDYQLISLAELASYIEKNHRLPAMPSAGEVKNEGIHLGEMDALLLQKIEELTLYVIQLEEDNSKMKGENLDLRNQNTQLAKDVQLIKETLGIR